MPESSQHASCGVVGVTDRGQPVHSDQGGTFVVHEEFVDAALVFVDRLLHGNHHLCGTEQRGIVAQGVTQGA